MKLCADSKCTRQRPLRLSEFYMNRSGRTADKRCIYCKRCTKRRVYAARALKREERLAAKAANRQAEEVTRVSESVQLKLFVETQIRLLTKHGASRELIRRETNAPWDLITDCLADLWDKGEVKIERRGDERLFYSRRAA